jgi:hypothetical protein
MSPGASHPDPLRHVRIDLDRPDPDPAAKKTVFWIRMQSDQWIRIRNLDPDPGGQK